MFETAESFYGAAPGVTPAERPTVLHGRPNDVAAMVAAGKKRTKGVVRARVEHSRWLVDCPDPSCRGCQYASREDRRFFCNYCHNGAVGGAWIRVSWPNEAKTTQIEQVLAERPDPRTRNWFPDETVEALRSENALIGGGS